MVLGLVEASDVLESSKVLDYAKQTFQYVMSGEDDKLGGGIYWRESDRASKNTCSNGPAIAGAIALFRKTGGRTLPVGRCPPLLWTRNNLRDPDDGLYWDNIALNGRIQKAKWSYNTGLMLRDAAELYDLTKDPEYAGDAKQMQSASLKHWVGEDGALKDDGKFMHLLLENWLRAYRLVPGVEDPRPAITTGLAFLHDKVRDSLGHYGNHWDKPSTTEPFSPFALIDQAAAARASWRRRPGWPSKASGVRRCVTARSGGWFPAAFLPV